MNNQRISYLLKSAIAFFDQKRNHCPNCGNTCSSLVDSKYFFTRLRRCKNCCLLYRSPTDSSRSCEEFYQESYDGGVATELPGQEKLEAMMDDNFRSFANSYWTNIDILEKIGIEKGARVLDYGASWGYGTYQWCKRGYEAEGFEIGRSRAAFARKKLDVKVSSSVNELEGLFDIFYSCHVIEHVIKLSAVFTLANRILKPGGLFIAFTPNGSDERRDMNYASWKKSWGLVHPLLLDKEFYLHEFRNKPLVLASSPYRDITGFSDSEQKILDISGDELLCVVRW